VRVTPVASAQEPIAGWAPTSIVDVPSHRRVGAIKCSFDALRGVTELGNGQPLTDVQVSTLAPFLSKSYDLPEAVVRTDLANTRVYIGGPATKPGWAFTMGTDLYVPGHRELERLLSWDGRRWLSHELGHTMQWRKLDAPNNLARTRRDYLQYAGQFFRDPGPGHGAIVDGIKRWVDERRNPRPELPKQPFGNALHDAHPREIEAEKYARIFAGMPPKP
jgi:hypothetical protein